MQGGCEEEDARPLKSMDTDCICLPYAVLHRENEISLHIVALVMAEKKHRVSKLGHFFYLGI